jgi:hypothetical protein
MFRCESGGRSLYDLASQGKKVFNVESTKTIVEGH